MDLFAAINFNNFILIDIFENMWGVHQNSNGAGRGYNEEYIELQAIDDHCHVFPIFACLKSNYRQNAHSVNYRTYATSYLRCDAILPGYTNPHSSNARQ